MKDIPVDNLRAKQDEEGNSTSSKNIVGRNDEAQAGIKNIGDMAHTQDGDRFFVDGIVFLSAAVAPLLIPLTIASKSPNGWDSASIIVILILGGIVRRQIAVGIGGDAQYSSTTRVQALTDHQHIAVTIAVYLTCVELGGAIGSAISGAVWENDIPSKFREYLPPGSKQQAQSIYNSINNAFNFPVGSAERIGINRAYRESIHILLSSQFVLDPQVKGRVIGGRVEDDTDVQVAWEPAGGPGRGLGRWLQSPLMKKQVTSET
ncbi:hypothetical protein B0J14DRAFT_706339 [Halenospora varia]|nr:hypothetical protein B0J14DRAFT_706339 [Halenospora varia]